MKKDYDKFKKEMEEDIKKFQNSCFEEQPHESHSETMSDGPEESPIWYETFWFQEK